MALTSNSVLETANNLSSSPQCLHEVERLTQYPVKLMQYEEELALQLTQKINQIIVNHSTAAAMLQDIAQVLGITFKVDCCCLVTVSNEEFSEEIAANWCAEEFLGSQSSKEIFSTQQLDLPVVQCACEPTIEDISTIQNSLAVGCQCLPVAIKAVLAIPTRLGNKNNGVINLIKSQPYNWSDGEKHLLKAIEAVCAIAFAQVAQVRLIALQQQYLQLHAQHQNLIKQLTILNRSNLELNQMLQLTLAATAEALQADRGLLILLKYSDPLLRTLPRKQIPKAKATVVGEWIRKSANSQLQQSQSQDTSFWLSECNLCQRAFHDYGKPIILSADTQHRDVFPAAPVFALKDLPAALVMPLESQGKILGFLVLQQAKPRHWQAAELNMVEMVCAQASNAIIQNQTLRRVQTLVDERTAQLQRSLDVQAKLYEKQRRHVEQLRELNQLKDEFLSNMSDRLRYPLTNMRMALRILRQPGITPERQAKYLDILEQECSKEINLINDLLTLQKLETHHERPQYETIDLNARIQDLAASFQKKFLEQGLSINLDLPNQPLKLQTELESFDRILQELLTNAGKFSERDTTVQLQARHQIIEHIDRVIIKVTNTGMGISQEEASYIFDKFRRGKGRWTPGTGLGLALVKSLVQHLNGEIAVESTPVEDSNLSRISFTLSLPQFATESKPYSESD
jgi:signal transduction histidine kinase